MADPQQQAQAEPFVPSEAQRRPHGAFVTKVYQGQIGGFCSPDTEKLLARKHLQKTGVLLRYSFEIGKREVEWEARLRAYLEAHQAPMTQKLRMPKETASKELVRLERMYASRPHAKAVGEKTREAEDFRHMNSLRAILGMEPHDYAEKGVPAIGKEVLAEFDALQQIVEPDARLAAVRVLRNTDLLRLLMLGDSNAAVRELAERRYGEAMVGVR